VLIRRENLLLEQHEKESDGEKERENVEQE
jgi:hypothetical protein